MTEEQKNPRPEVTPEADVLYSESFARERKRKSRRSSLIFGIGAMIYGGFVIHDTVIAIPTGKLVELGGYRHRLELPPFLVGQSESLQFSSGSGFWETLFSAVSDEDLSVAPRPALKLIDCASKFVAVPTNYSLLLQADCAC